MRRGQFGSAVPIALTLLALLMCVITSLAFFRARDKKGWFLMKL